MMKTYWRLLVIAAAGIISMLLATWGLYILRDKLVANGYAVSDEMFLLAFVVFVGGIFSVSAAGAMREIRRLNDQKSRQAEQAR